MSAHPQDTASAYFLPPTELKLMILYHEGPIYEFDGADI